MAEEEEVYAGEEVEGELEADGEEQGGHEEQDNQEGAEGEESAPKTEGDDQEKELEAMKKRLAEMEAEAAALKRMQDKSSQEMGGTSQGANGEAASQNREEADARSIYVGNVDYACTPEELQQHFQECGVVNRVTILADAFGQPKGFAYVEFNDAECVPLALQYNESELHGRQIKVTEKRTNVPGLKIHRGRPRGFYPHTPYRPRRPYGGYGRVPRFRRPTRYRPYY